VVEGNRIYLYDFDERRL